ncbi:MAG: response regulator [Candidatus Lokiarchaeota archaeon]|nr:response regulator [Candidatus Lokiarchaeota archaeon]
MVFGIVSIFIVEDDISLQNLYRMLFTSTGHNVLDIANNGMDAVEKFKAFNKKPEIIIMDHRMPIKNGIEATKEILKLHHNVKIIFASADISIREEALSIGATLFIEKPFDIQEVLNKIDSIFMTH